MFGQYSHPEPALIVFFIEDLHWNFSSLRIHCRRAYTRVSAVAMPTAEGLKAEANAAYAGNKFADAVKLYTQ